VAVHGRNLRKYGYPTQKEHLPANQQWVPEWSVEYFVGRARRIGSSTRLAVEDLLSGRPYPEQACKSCAGVLSLEKKYGKERLEKLHLLILDDWGLPSLDLAARMAILQIMEDRHGKGSTIITSQLPVSKWYEYLADPTLADAILDRILHQAHRIELKGGSLRKRENLSEITS
jgi:hypothetical protein